MGSDRLAVVHGRDGAGRPERTPPNTAAVADGSGPRARLPEPGDWSVESDTRRVAGVACEVVRWRRTGEREEVVGVGPRDGDPDHWTATVHDLDRPESRRVAVGEDREEVLGAASEWVAAHPRGSPPGFFGPRAGGSRVSRSR